MMKVLLGVVILLGITAAVPVQKNGETFASIFQNLLNNFELEDLAWLKDLIVKVPSVKKAISHFHNQTLVIIRSDLQKCPHYAEISEDLLKMGVNINTVLDKAERFLKKTEEFESDGSLEEWLNKLYENLDYDNILTQLKQIENSSVIQQIKEFFNGEVVDNFLDCISEITEVKDLINMFKEEGSDIITNLINVLVVNFKDRKHHRISRRGILDDVIKDLKLAELLPWLREKIDNDPDAQKVVKFFKSEEYDHIQSDIKSCPTYANVDKTLKKYDIDLDKIMIDIKTFVTGEAKRFRRSLGNILDEFLTEKIDFDELLDYIKEKEIKDNIAHELLEYLRGQELKDLESCANESPYVQDLIETLQQEDIDVPRLLKIVKVLFGIK